MVRPLKLDPGFSSWAFREYGVIEEIVARSTGVSYPAINASEIGDLPLPLPPLDEQRAIAAFLDRETERIDALVAKKRMLIERLREYHTALITRTVTRRRHGPLAAPQAFGRGVAGGDAGALGSERGLYTIVPTLVRDTLVPYTHPPRSSDPDRPPARFVEWCAVYHAAIPCSPRK